MSKSTGKHYSKDIKIASALMWTEIVLSAVFVFLAVVAFATAQYGWAVYDLFWIGLTIWFAKMGYDSRKDWIELSSYYDRRDADHVSAIPDNAWDDVYN